MFDYSLALPANFPIDSATENFTIDFNNQIRPPRATFNQSYT